MIPDTDQKPAGVSEQLKRSIVAHYEAQLERFGPTARGMDWKDEASQHLRFSVLCAVCDLSGKSVLDVGAGAGHLHNFMRERRITVEYHGTDLSAAMVEAARRLHPGVPFERCDLLLDPPRTKYDVVLCSGLFHVKLDHGEEAWRLFVEATVRRMFESCQIAIAFNLMSDHVNFRSPQLFYANPGEVVDFCRRELSPFVTVRHDYPLHEFTTYVYRDGRGV